MEMLNESIDVTDKPLPSYRRLWCAIASAIIPGLGDWLLGHKRRAGLFLSLLTILLLCYWPLRLPRFYVPFLLMVFACLVLNVASGCCTFLLGRSERDAGANWWLLILIALAVFSSSLERAGELGASGFQVFSIPSTSMSPTIKQNDDVVVDRWYFRNRKVQSGEVVVFRHRDLFLVKRLIATGGNTIVGIDGRVEVNGQILTENYAVHSDPENTSVEMNTFGPFKVPEDQLFVMGDNRDLSLDSRIRSAQDDFGPVFVTDIIGKPIYRFSRTIRLSDNDGQKIN